MSIYITKDGQKKKINVSATDVQLLDIDGRFKSKNLEDALKEVGSGTEENMTRIENKVEQLSNPNLLVNGDFRVNTKCKESFTEQNTETINKWLSTFADTESITVDRHYNNDSNSYYMRVTFTEIGANKAGSNLHQILEDTANGYSIVAGKTVTFSADCYATTSARCIFIGYTTNRGTSFEYAIEPIIKDVDKKRYKITTTIPANATQVHCGLGMCRLIDDTMVGQYADIYNAKLEIGEYATPFTPKPYHEELLACNDGIIGSNPNLLINGDFQVWQRGTSFSTNGYTADRWMYDVEGDDKGKIVKHADGGVQIKLISNKRFWFMQRIELNQELKNIFSNSTVTLSFYVTTSAGVKISPYIRVWSPSRNANIFLKSYEAKETRQLIKCQITLGDLSSDDWLGIDIFRIEEDNKFTVGDDLYIRFENVKLEVGSVATQFVPRLYAEELALCQRYYFRNRWLSLRTAVCTENELRTSSYYFPVPMRVSPTINTVIGQPIHEFYTPNLTYHVGQPSLGTIAPKPMVIYNNVMCDFQFATNNVPKNDYTIEIKDNVYEFDAEIY